LSQPLAPGEEAPARGTGPRAALANRNYRLFIAGQLVSQSGGWMARIAQAWLVLQISDSPMVLGTVVTLQFLPILLLSLFAGVLADRVPKRRALVAIQAIGIGQASALAILAATGQVELWHIYALALVQGIANAMEQPLRQAFPAELVGRDLIPSAVALNAAVHNSARILGPSLGGVVVAWLDVAGAFALNAASYGAVLVTLAAMRLERDQARNTRLFGNPLAEIGETIAFAASQPLLVFTLGSLTCLGIFGFNYSTFLPLLARYELDMGPSGYGILSAGLGAGAILGALAVARAGRGTPSRQVWGGLAFALVLGCVGLSGSPFLSVLLLAALGIAGTTFTTTANTTLQMQVPDRMRGRIMGLYTLLLAGMTPPGAMVTGFLADAWGARWALAIEGGICLSGVLLGARYLAWSRRAPPLPLAEAQA
jgi:MFS family permease